MDRGHLACNINPCYAEITMKERVVILGSGESGTGAALLAQVKGFDIFVSDSGPIKEKYRADLDDHHIPYEEGKHSSEKILNANIIIKSPGVPDKADIVKAAKAASIEIIDEIEFAFRYIRGKVIAITGTNGKTTTTLLTYHLMKAAGMNVALAGNVGFSLARQVAQQPHDWYVLEVSSFQIDGTKTFKPDVAVILNITPDHLDRYEYKMENYVDSKFRLVSNMDPLQHFIYYGDDPVVSGEMNKRTVDPSKVMISLKPSENATAFFDGDKMNFRMKEHFAISQDETTLKGPHNLINTMAAVSAVYLAGARLELIKEGLLTFKNAPHRLEPVGTINGVDFINDSKATNVDSVVYALGSYDGPLIWIAGGVDKGNDYNIIKEDVRKKVRALICLGKDNEKLKKAFGGVVHTIKETQSVAELVRMALQEAKTGDVVLLSPACASFDLFRNYEDRGDQFRKAVGELKQEIENN